MDELSLYKFVSKNNLEYHWAEDEDVLLFVDNSDIDEFSKLMSSTIYEDGGLQGIHMKQGYFVFNMKDICEHHDIELEKVFEK